MEKMIAGIQNEDTVNNNAINNGVINNGIINNGIINGNITNDNCKDILIQTNKYQTHVTKELMASLPQEVQEQLMECLTNIEYIKRLISPDRPYAKDLPKDKCGKIIQDLANPHIIENAEYFTKAAQFYKENQCYTFLKPNSNPNSEYRKFWDEEIRRCREGYIRPDGEWITGYMYYFLNYSPIMLNIIHEGNNRMAERVESLPEFWEGIYLRSHYLNIARLNGHHAIELAKRGCGKSFFLASIMAHNLLLGENAKVTKRVTTILTAFQKEYLADKDGTLSKFEPMINFAFDNTPFPHLLLKNTSNQMIWQMGYKDEYGRQKGSLNNVMGVSSKDDEGKLRGKRGYIFFEEMGSFPNLLSVYDTVRYGVEEGDYTFGLIYLVGTAAQDESDFSSAKTLLYGTQAYNIQEIKNVYDRPKQGKPTFGYFFPAFINRKGCYNKDGVSDVVKSLIQILKARYAAKYSSDPTSIINVIAQMPITPAEAIIKVKSAFFPVTMLTERLQQLDLDPKAYDDVSVGDLIYDTKNNSVKFVPTDDQPIKKYGVENSTKGALEIYEHPQYNKSTGKVFHNRYIIGHDPVDNDQAESNSLSSTFVFDLFNDAIVAEYTGREELANSNFEKVRLLCLYYDAPCLYESNKKGLYAYFDMNKCTHLLADTPEYLRDKQMVKYSSFGSNQKGVNASAAINNYANSLIKDWLLKPVAVTVKEDDQDKQIMVPRLYTVRNRALIEECIAFTPEINVDRIRALGMVMLYRQQQIILYGDNLNSESREKIDSGYAGNDSFFTKNYKPLEQMPYSNQG